MQAIIAVCAPRTWFQAALVFCLFQALIQLAHVAVDYALHGQMTAPQLLSEAIVVFGTSAPFVLFALALMRHQLVLSQSLARLAATDELTGLPNRRQFFRQAAQYRDLDGAKLLMIDLDRFKQINDTFGHAHGDACLVMFANEIRQLCGPDDQFARLGGEEFVILMPNRSLQAASRLAWSLTRRFALENYGKQTGALTSSIGLAVGDAQSDLSQLMRRADKGLYAAKAAGRACVVTWTEDVCADVTHSDKTAKLSVVKGVV